MQIGQEQFRQDMNRGFHVIERQHGVAFSDIGKLRAQQNDLEDRVESLEGKRP
ncbi:MAG: hypothetical protein ACRD9R_18450 [Pyrinomonadaceae bacterium]